VTFWGVSAGTSGRDFDGEGVFQQPLLGRDLLTLLLEVLDREFDSLPRHRYRVIDRLSVGDAAWKHWYGHRIPALWLAPKEDAVMQVSHLVSPVDHADSGPLVKYLT